jgi:Tol biopolymer transport system component
MLVIVKRTLLLGLLTLLLCACGEAAVQGAGDTAAPPPSLAVTEGTAVPEAAQQKTATATSEPTATATATPEPVATLAESTPTSESVEPMETPTPTSTSEVVALELPATATPVVEQTSTAGLQGRFVFQVASGGDIYTVNADGSDLKRVTYGMDPDWSADGSQITFVRWSEPWGIYTINADGSGERLLFSSNVARAPVWSPDGTQIAFYFQTEGMTAGDTMCMPGAECRRMPGHLQTEWHVGVVDVADGYLHQPYVDRFSFSPTWSADGEWLVYDGGDSGTLPSEVRGLCLTTVEGPNNAVLTNNTNDHYPVWSPDGTKIAFMHWKHDHWEIFIINADGSDRHPLTSSSNYVKPVANNVAPEWSPDGKQIVFLSDRSGGWEFYVMNADGSDQTQILSNVTGSLDIQYTAEYERVISWAP